MHLNRLSFPTRRSSDLQPPQENLKRLRLQVRIGEVVQRGLQFGGKQRDTLPTQQLERLELRSEEHTSELQSRGHLVCRLLLEKKKHRNEFCFSYANKMS